MEKDRERERKEKMNKDFNQTRTGRQKLELVGQDNTVCDKMRHTLTQLPTQANQETVEP